MLSKLILNPFQGYVFAGLGTLLLVLTAITFFQTKSINRLNEKVGAANVSLQTSEQSLKRSNEIIVRTKKDWQAAEIADKKRLALTERLLAEAEKKNAKLRNLAEKLRSNTSGTTPIPEDINDAWKQL